jgi:hypothetical protein
VPRFGRLLHNDEVPRLQVSDEVVRHEPGHQIVPVAEPAAAVMLKGEAQCEAKLIGIGRRQLGCVIAHTGRLDQPEERIKNTLPAPPSPTRPRRSTSMMNKTDLVPGILRSCKIIAALCSQVFYQGPVLR